MVGLILQILPISFTFHHLFINRCNTLMVNAINGGGGKIYEGKPLNDSITKAIEENVPSSDKKNRKIVEDYTREIKKCFLRYGITPNDYFLFGFHTINKKHSSRRLFVTDTCKDYTLCRYDGWQKYLELSDKYAVYKRVPEYFGRKAMRLDSSVTLNDFVNFVMNTSSLFIKPLSGSYGHGAMIFDFKDYHGIGELYKQLLSESTDSWMIEERIVQDPEMAKWNDSSVNTVRFTSILTKKGYYVLTPVLRTGRSGSIVDNGGSGGILSNIDIETGRIYTDGIDEHGHTFIAHPDSLIIYKGWHVPKWRELLNVAEAVHRAMPDHKYVGWDFALSENGWVLIEGNWGQFLNQYVDKRGRKEEFLKYIKE